MIDTEFYLTSGFHTSIYSKKIPNIWLENTQNDNFEKYQVYAKSWKQSTEKIFQICQWLMWKFLLWEVFIFSYLIYRLIIFVFPLPSERKAGSVYGFESFTKKCRENRISVSSIIMQFHPKSDTLFSPSEILSIFNFTASLLCFNIFRILCCWEIDQRTVIWSLMHCY